MATDRFARVFGVARRRRVAVLAGLLTLAALALVRLATAPFDTSIDAMLPDAPEVLRSIRFLRSGKLGENVVISLARDAAKTDVATLHEAVDAVASSMGEPLVTRVVAEVPSTALEEDLDAILARLPEVVTDADLAAIDARLTPDGVDAALKERYRQLLSPQMAYTASLVSRDPLNLGSALLKDVNGLVSAVGYEVDVEAGHLVNPARTRALVILETTVPMTDAVASAELLEYIRERLTALPAGITADVVCGHEHTVANERTLRADLQLTVTLAAIGFVVLFLVSFRDPRAVFVFMIPVVAVVLSMAGVALAGPLSAFVVGIGGVVAGIAVDYGIHAYVAVRHGTDPRHQIERVVRPIALGAMTTTGVFVAFFFSSTPGYRELAWFAVPSIAISLACALLVLPQWILPGEPDSVSEQLARRPTSRRRDLGVAVALVLAIVALGVAASRATFESDLLQLDGSPAEVKDAEERFRADWLPSGSEPAMLVVERADYQAALDAGRHAGEQLIESIGPDGVVITPLLWPSETRRAENVARWNRFWADGRADRVRTLLTEQGEPYGFSEDAFAPFLASVADRSATEIAPHEDAFFDRLRDRFVVESDGTWKTVSMLPERPECRAAARAVAAADGNAFVVSRAELSEALSSSVTSDLTRIGGIALALVALAIIGLVRSLVRGVIVLVPAVAACLAVVATAPLLGLSLNVANLVAGIVVLGLAIDYGIFMVHGHRDLARTTLAAVTLSAVSTLVGAGVLVFADHPALASIGTTLTAGVTTAYVASVLAVPALHRLWHRKPDEEAR